MRRRGAAAARIGQRRSVVGDPHQVHAMVQQWQHHREQRALLARRARLRGGEYARGLARQCAVEPQAGGPSRKYFKGAAILPKRVGLPSSRPSARRSSSSVA